jgi:hypothetical protein
MSRPDGQTLDEITGVDAADEALRHDPDDSLERAGKSHHTKDEQEQFLLEGHEPPERLDRFGIGQCVLVVPLLETLDRRQLTDQHRCNLIHLPVDIRRSCSAAGSGWWVRTTARCRA